MAHFLYRPSQRFLKKSQSFNKEAPDQLDCCWSMNSEILLTLLPLPSPGARETRLRISVDVGEQNAGHYTSASPAQFSVSLKFSFSVHVCHQSSGLLSHWYLCFYGKLFLTSLLVSTFSQNLSKCNHSIFYSSVHIFQKKFI